MGSIPGRAFWRTRIAEEGPDWCSPCLMLKFWDDVKLLPESGVVQNRGRRVTTRLALHARLTTVLAPPRLFCRVRLTASVVATIEPRYNREHATHRHSKHPLKTCPTSTRVEARLSHRAIAPRKDDVSTTAGKCHPRDTDLLLRTTFYTALPRHEETLVGADLAPHMGVRTD